MLPIQTNHGYPLGRAFRVLLALWSLFLTSGFVLAVQLEPDRRGYGTHENLGLPPCTMMSMFSVPCPSCGMTTSFAHFVRGEFWQAAEANIAGLLLAVFCAVQIPWCWISIYYGRFWKVSRPEITLLCILVLVIGIGGVQWFFRLSNL